MGSKFVVESEVRKYIRSKGCRTSGELFSTLGAKVLCLLDGAAERAKAGDRKTVDAADL